MTRRPHTVDNEAALQARLEARIRAAFPLLPAQVKLEHHIKLRLGHHVVTIDGKKTAADLRGRYDVLVLTDGKPLFIAELKAPHVSVTDDDVEQALSYARLHQPMVPLVLVTNGVITFVRRTYDGSELPTNSSLTSILSAAASLAAADSEDAIRILLASSSDTWEQLFAEWNKKTLESITGPARDFKYQIAEELTISRRAVQQLSSIVLAGVNIAVLHGPPMSGVTNVLAQLARSSTLGPCLFIDSKSTRDILQDVANRLSREVLHGISKDDVRQWINTGRGLNIITFVVDGLARDSADELVEYARAGLIRLVFGVDSETHRTASLAEGRTHRSLFGLSHSAVELASLSDEEFSDALDAFDAAFGAHFLNGAQYCPELRWPRTLRVLAAMLPRTRSVLRTEVRETRLMLDPIPGPAMLSACSRAFGSEPMLKFDLQRLAAAYLADAAEHIDTPEWLEATWGRPSIDPVLLESTIGEQRMARLRDYGFLSWSDTRTFGPRLLVRVEELLAHHVADEWCTSLAKLMTTEAVTAKLERLIHLANAVPLGDVALAAAIARAAEKNPLVLGASIRHLLQDAPISSRLQEGAEVALLTKDGPIRLRFGERMDEEVVGNMKSWIVLSHLASLGMAADGHAETANFSIFAELGACPHFLYQPRPVELARVPAFHFHEVEGLGSVPCFHMGIVEPLLQAMLVHARSFPEEFVLLAEFAKDQEEIHLAWRLLAVAMTAKPSTDDAVMRAAEAVKELLGDWWGIALSKSISAHEEGPTS